MKTTIPLKRRKYFRVQLTVFSIFHVPLSIHFSHSLSLNGWLITSHSSYSNIIVEKNESEYDESKLHHKIWDVRNAFSKNRRINRSLWLSNLMRQIASNMKDIYMIVDASIKVYFNNYKSSYHFQKWCNKKY